MNTTQQPSIHMKRSRDEASKLLGEKMLQGWALLNASCPVEDCYTPLMRNKQSKMFCVRCDQYVITEADAMEQKAKEKMDEELASTEKEQIEAEACCEEERRRSIEQQFYLEEQAKQNREMQELQEAKMQYPEALKGSAKRKIDKVVSRSSSNSDADVNIVRRQTLAALYQKMEALTDSLTPNDHSERLISVAKAVREIAEAAQLLK